MAVGLKPTVSNAILNALLRNTSYTGAANLYMQLHTGNPGAAGTSNVATNTTRQAVTFAAGSAGSAVSNADVTWTSVAATETYTFFSVWDASTAGNFQFSGTVTGGAVLLGATFTVPSGTETAVFALAA